MGQLVLSQTAYEDGMVINTSGFAEGVYSVSLRTKTGTVTRRFAVMH